MARIFHPHDPALVLLTFTLAVLASFVSLELAGRIKAARGRLKFAWLAAAGTAMGGGIWSMHFVAMIALQLPFAVAYEPWLTVASLFVAVGFATGGLYAVFWHRGSPRRFVFAGCVMGLGVAAMHYTGMAALIMPAVAVYDMKLVVLSVAVAVAASIAALWIADKVVHLWQKALSALIMGAAVAGMHFTGMAAVSFIGGGGALAAPGLSETWLAASVAGITLAILLMGLVLAVLDQRRARQAWVEHLARESERRINTLLDHAADLIAIVDRQWTIRYLTAASRHFSAAPLGVGGVLLALFEPDAHEPAGELMRSAAANPGQAVRAAFRGAKAAETWFELSLNDRSADRAIGGTIVNLRDITAQKQATAQIEAALAQAREAARLAEAQAAELATAHEATRAAEDHALELEKAHAARRAAEEQANRLARHDALTGLSNRRVFTHELEAAFQRARSGAGYSSLILVDLDGFKKINDLHGHQVGDAVLCEVARRLEMTMRKNDSVARLGGDEFAIIAEGRMDLEEHQAGALRLAGRVLSAIQLPMTTAEGRLEIGACLGIAFCRAEASDTSFLLHAADIAMYRAKQHGRGTFRFFEQRMDDEMREKEAIERDLIAAVAQETIQPYFMPLVDIARGRVCGFEALARWQHAERGFIAPDVFIPVVEQLGLMAELTNSVLRQACRAARDWPEEIKVAVNFSPSELKDPMLPSRILSILTQEGLAPARLEVEITETALITDTDAAKATLTTLQGFGVTICLDDFGTGYSSLSHLRELRFDRVKIDRSFIQAMQENADSEKIVDAILGLTRSLTLPAVAEGIENQAVLNKLAGKGCEFGQGYYFGKAVTAAAAGALLQAGTAKAA